MGTACGWVTHEMKHGLNKVYCTKARDSGEGGREENGEGPEV